MQHLGVPEQLVDILRRHLQLTGVDEEEEAPEDLGRDAGQLQGWRAGGGGGQERQLAGEVA